MKNYHLWHLFTSTAAVYPNELAVIANDKQLSYQDLQQEVFFYVDYLQRAGVNVGDKVAIYLPRDSRLIVALLAVLACGASYVPLDARNPHHRNQTILDDSGCQYLISDTQESQETISLITPPCGEKLFSLPRHEKRDKQELAYLIYTSGSTGKPKGVMINHANACAMVHWALSVYSRKDLAYTLAATSICFDLSVFEIFVPLSVGGCVVLVDHALSLLTQPCQYPITLINTVPSAIEALNQARAIPDSVQVINLAGEALQQSIVNQLYEHTPVQRVYNLYGPSETTTYSTYYLVEPNHERVMVPIGKAITGTQIYLLDQHQQPVPKLVRGEIYIAGAGVSLGYCNRPEESQAAFVTLSINGESIKLYKTGDLARMNHAGELEYLGRKDQQIKIRGFRVEPDEISHAIKQHDNSKQAYVMTHPEVDSGEQLIAYVVLREKTESACDVLKNWLEKQLPDYMVPVYYVELDALPVNTNGKIDRAALPLPGRRKAEVYEYQTDIERQLAIVWQGLLAKQSFNRLDNFFYIGGHSLLAARLQAKIQETFDIAFKLEEVFEKPSIADQAAVISERQAAKAEQPITFEVLARPNEIPLSFSQQRLWYLQYAEEATPISNIPIMLTLQGELDVEALNASIRHIIARHEILRTTYQSVNYQIMQIIHDDVHFEIAYTECSDETLPTLLEEEANKKFDLSKDLMIRVRLFKTATQRLLMVTQHHIASDAWSLNVLMQELSAYYRAYHRSLPLPQLSLPIQYADYSCWQRFYVNNRALDLELDFWKKKLDNAPDTIKLPYDRPRSDVQTYRGEFYQLEIEETLVAKLKTLANKNQATLFMVLLTGFNMLLHRYTQQNDFCIGILTANRPFSVLEHTLGFFVNTLTLRSQMDSSITSRQLLKEVKKNVLECLAHQQVPFDKVVETLRPNRQSNRHPFFQVLFSLQNALEADLELDGLTLEAKEYDRKISKFDLTLSLVEKSNKLSAIFEFNSDLFNRDTIARMATHYLTLLTHLADNVDQRLSDIDLLTPSERQQWLVDLNAVNVDYPALSLAACFDAGAKKWADKIAVIEGNNQYTYTELDAKSSQLANLLDEYGIAREAKVGLLLPRSIETIISMLAIAKAGGCYVPMDPAWPIDRLDYLLNDTNMNVIISMNGYTSHLPASSNVHIILLDEAEYAIAQASTNAPSRTIAPDDSCYIMYTSGSTGKPKGVIAQHKGVVRLVKQANYVQLDEHQTLLQVSQLVFDAATFDIWGSLLNGATLVLMPDGLPELNKLAELIMTHNVTTLFVTTQLFNTLVDYKLPALAPLKQLLFGGDVASLYHVEQFKAAYPTCTIRNIYGPTECTTYALSYLIPDGFDKTKSLPLGTPISNTSVVILSDDMQIVPVGVQGQICLGGPGLARAYLNQPELTQEKFINNPISELNTDRLYLTGDVGCYRADGQIAFFGRYDDQIKLRGYRIELPEIEQALRELEAIVDAVVLVQKPEDLLVAYVISSPGVSIMHQAIRQELSKRLPNYMLPDAVHVLSEFPLTTNGKIDKANLPRYQFNRRGTVEAGAAQDGVASLIHQIWVEVLNDDEVTDEDNFFEIGGNSLKIVHILDRLQAYFKDEPAILAKLDITVLFQYPTIMSLATYLKNETIEESSEGTTRAKSLSQRDKRKQASQ